MNRSCNSFRLCIFYKSCLKFFRILWCENGCLHSFLSCRCLLCGCCFFRSCCLFGCGSLCRSFLCCRCFRCLCFCRSFYFFCRFCFCFYFCCFCICICCTQDAVFTSSANSVYSFALLLDFLYSTTGTLLSWDHSTELSTRITCSNT